MLPVTKPPFIPRDVLLLARVVAAAGAVTWLVVGGPALGPLVFVTLAFLVATSALIWRDDRRRGNAPPLSGVPVYVVLGDIAAAATWMAASAPNQWSLAFVILLAVGALAMFRLGQLGVALTGGAYIVARVAQELIRISLGTPTAPAQLFAEGVVASLVL